MLIPFYLILFKMHSMENLCNCQIFVTIYIAFLFGFGTLFWRNIYGQAWIFSTSGLLNFFQNVKHDIQEDFSLGEEHCKEKRGW